MNVKYDHAGKRIREARDALAVMQDDEKWDDWPIKGPRTTRWVLNQMTLHAGSQFSVISGSRNVEEEKETVEEDDRF